MGFLGCIKHLRLVSWVVSLVATLCINTAISVPMIYFDDEDSRITYVLPAIAVGTILFGIIIYVFVCRDLSVGLELLKLQESHIDYVRQVDETIIRRLDEEERLNLGLPQKHYIDLSRVDCYYFDTPSSFAKLGEEANEAGHTFTSNGPSSPAPLGVSSGPPVARSVTAPPSADGSPNSATIVNADGVAFSHGLRVISPSNSHPMGEQPEALTPSESNAHEPFADRPPKQRSKLIRRKLSNTDPNLSSIPSSIHQRASAMSSPGRQQSKEEEEAFPEENVKGGSKDGGKEEGSKRTVGFRSFPRPSPPATFDPPQVGGTEPFIDTAPQAQANPNSAASAFLTALAGTEMVSSHDDEMEEHSADQEMGPSKGLPGVLTGPPEVTSNPVAVSRTVSGETVPSVAAPARLTRNPSLLARIRSEPLDAKRSKNDGNPPGPFVQDSYDLDLQSRTFVSREAHKLFFALAMVWRENRTMKRYLMAVELQSSTLREAKDVAKAKADAEPEVVVSEEGASQAAADDTNADVEVKSFRSVKSFKSFADEDDE